MYKLLLFSGGIYKFSEFEEFIEDIGGFIVKIDSFKISRGMYFLAEEIKVLLVAPSVEIEELMIFAKNIKGSIEKIDVEDIEKEKIILLFEIYKNLKINETLSFLNDIVNILKNKTDFISLDGFEIDKTFFNNEMEYCRNFSNNQKENNENNEEFIEYTNINEIIYELLDILEKMKIIEKIIKETSFEYKISLK